MSTVAQIIERSSVDITLNGSLLIGYDLAAVQVGVLDYGSGLLMVKCENRSEVDELGRGLFEWRIMDNAGRPVANGDELRNLDGGTHPMEGLLGLIDHLIRFAETGEDAYNDGFDALEDGNDYMFEFEHYISPLLPALRVELADAIGALDVSDESDA
jgi:hypothetical protein